MKILLFGKNGQVGWELNRSLLPLGDIIALGRQDADFSRPESIRKIVQEIRPDIIVNAVAYTAVDKAEEEEALALTINADTPAVLAEEAAHSGALLIHYSTDYVFDGSKTEAYSETDKPCPINAYGRTKLAGEQAIQASGCDYLIFRTSWVYASRGHNFLMTILRLAKERESLNIVADQTGAPTSARLIADSSSLCLKQAINERRQGVFSADLFHLTASGVASWHEFAETIVDAARCELAMKLKTREIRPISASQYPAPATRPMNSQLSLDRLERVFGVKMPHWQVAIQVCMQELGNKSL